MLYIFKCDNDKCEDFEKEFEVRMGMNEDQSKVKCDTCSEKARRVFTPLGIKTFGDGYKA